MSERPGFFEIVGKADEVIGARSPKAKQMAWNNFLISIVDLYNDVIDEVLIKKFTKSILVTWIKDQHPIDEAKYCALYYDKKANSVAAFLMSSDLQFLYNDKAGKRIAVVFRAEYL